MNKHELKSLLENIYTALTEAESSHQMTPEGPDGEAIPWDYRTTSPLDPTHFDPNNPIDLDRIPLPPTDPPLGPGELWYWDGHEWIRWRDPNFREWWQWLYPPPREGERRWWEWLHNPDFFDWPRPPWSPHEGYEG